MKKYVRIIVFPFLFACSQPAEEIPNLAPSFLAEQQKSFPLEPDSIYGTWMETSEWQNGKVSMRRWFFISRDYFGIGQWCFKGARQVFTIARVPAIMLDETLQVLENVSGISEDKDLPCEVRFPKGYYGINRVPDTIRLQIIFPDVGEMITAIAYNAPVPLLAGGED